jgi:hypothetical protein
MDARTANTEIGLTGCIDDAAFDAEAVGAIAYVAAGPDAPYAPYAPYALDRINRLKALLRKRACIEAEVTTLLSEINADREADELDPTEDQLAAATGWSTRMANKRLAQAARLTKVFPRTVQCLAQGTISLEHAQILSDLTGELTEQGAQAVEAAVLPLMPAWSVRKTREEVSRAVLELNPKAAEERHAKEVEQRRVELRPMRHGMAALTGFMSAELARAAYDALTSGATALKKAEGETRTLDQLRHDLFEVRIRNTGDAADGARAAKPKTETVVVIQAATVCGLEDQPGELEGHGPIDPQHARTLSLDADARWRLVITDVDGVLMAASSRRYRPCDGLRLLAILFYRTCVFPNCTRAAKYCDLDHVVPFGKGGWTILDNLAPLCRRHHRMKTKKKVRLQRIGGALVWTLADGQVHITRPRPYLPLRR